MPIGVELLDGERSARWLIPVAALICVAAALFFVAWLGQI